MANYKKKLLSEDKNADQYHDTEQFRKLNAENGADGIIRAARWASMREEFIERTITGQMVHWPTLSAKYGFFAQSARNKASVQKWHAEVEKRAKEREDLLDAKMTERHLMVLDRLNADFATSEEAIRKRHAMFARSLQEKAMEGLRTRPLKDFKARDLIHLLELGIIEERRAMGMKEMADLPAPPDENEAIREGYKSVFEQVGGHQKVQQIGTILLRELQRTNGVIDVPSRSAVQSTAPAEPEYKPVPEPKKKPKFTIKVGPKPAGAPA